MKRDDLSLIFSQYIKAQRYYYINEFMLDWLKLYEMQPTGKSLEWYTSRSFLRAGIKTLTALKNNDPRKLVFYSDLLMTAESDKLSGNR